MFPPIFHKSPTLPPHVDLRAWVGSRVTSVHDLDPKFESWKGTVYAGKVVGHVNSGYR